MNLTEFSYTVKKNAPFAVIGVLLLIIVYYIFKLLFIYISTQNKTVPIQYNIAFGKLGRPRIKNKIEKTYFKYTLDNIEGEPVTATLAAKIFLIPPTRPRLSFKQRVYDMAKALGFEGIDLSKKFNYKNNHTVVFDDGKKIVEIDIANFNFTYELKYHGREDLFTGDYIPGEETIKNKSIDFLTLLNRYPDELTRGKKAITYLRISPLTDNIEVVSRPEDANAVEVDFYRPNIDEYKFVTPKYFTSQNYVVFAFKSETFVPIKAQIKFFEKSNTEIGIYPLKTGDQAWQELRKGNAIVVASPLNKVDIVIKDMFLAYLDPDIYQKYIQPVYVFVGRDNFVGYVPAVSNDYLGK